MSIFCSKKLSAPEPLGQILLKAREHCGLSLEEFSTKIGVPKNYIHAIEKNAFNELPPIKFFRLAYLRAYVSALNLEQKNIFDQFKREGGLSNVKDGNTSPLKNLSKFSFFSSSVLLRNSAIAIVVILFASYLGWQVKGILEAPKLTVYTPIEGAVSNQIGVLVQGQSEKEVHLTVNGQSIMINEKGQFESLVDLSNGVNTITISAMKKHGRATTVTRHVVVKTTEGDQVTLKH